MKYYWTVLKRIDREIEFWWSECGGMQFIIGLVIGAVVVAVTLYR